MDFKGLCETITQNEEDAKEVIDLDDHEMVWLSVRRINRLRDQCDHLQNQFLKYLMFFIISSL